MALIVRTQDKIDELLSEISSIKNALGSKYPGMSFEEGLEQMYEWLTGETDENPLELE